MTRIVSKIIQIRWQHTFLVLAIAIIAMGAGGCKSTGKLSKKERKAQIETAKKQLQPIVDGTSTLSLQEQDRLISGISSKNLNDPDLNQMLLQASQKVKQGFAEQEKITSQKEDAARAVLYDLLVNKENKTADQLEKELDAIKAQNLSDPEISELISKVEKKIQGMRSYNSEASLPVKTQLENSFDGIAGAAKGGNLEQADNLIRAALQFFTSESAPVLIIISRDGSMVDYDKPTTIGRYLQYLKDQKANNNAIDAMQLDASGKIKELDLIKK